MGFKADTHVTDTGLVEQEPESASDATTTPSDGSAGVDDSGASSLSSPRHQEEVQNSKDRCEVMDAPMVPDDNFIAETKFSVKDPEITSVASIRSRRADPTPSDNSGGGDGIGAPCPWSLPQEQHVRNLKNNCRHAFGFRRSTLKIWSPIAANEWFAEVVAKIRDDPFLDNSEVEFKGGPIYLDGARLLHLAVLMGDLEMVQKILEIHLERDKNIDSLIKGPWASYSALDLAIVGGESKMVDVLLEKKAKVNMGYKGSLQLAVIFSSHERMKNTLKIIQSLVHNDIDLKFKDGYGYTAFYLAVAKGKIKIVRMFLNNWQDKIELNEACKEGRPPIQIAHVEGFKDIERALMRCDDVSRYIDSEYRDRQAYVDAANAILVGAALIASVTFASWLQPPLNYTTSYHGSSMEYVDVEHNFALGCFWVFNTLSFYFAIGTVVFGAQSVLPRPQLFITENVEKLSQNLVLTSILLAFSVFFVIIAFGIAGFIVLIPILRYRWYMIAPTILGGIVCVGSIGYLFKSLWDNRPWKERKKEM